MTMQTKNVDTANTYALVTGASSGIGKAIARECAAMGMGMLLVSLPDTGLPRVAEQIAAESNVDVRYLECDLAKPETPYQVQRWTREQGVRLRMVVNNAGVDLAGLTY